MPICYLVSIAKKPYSAHSCPLNCTLLCMRVLQHVLIKLESFLSKSTIRSFGMSVCAHVHCATRKIATHKHTHIGTTIGRARFMVSSYCTQANRICKGSANGRAHCTFIQSISTYIHTSYMYMNWWWMQINWIKFESRLFSLIVPSQRVWKPAKMAETHSQNAQCKRDRRRKNQTRWRPVCAICVSTHCNKCPISARWMTVVSYLCKWMPRSTNNATNLPYNVCVRYAPPSSNTHINVFQFN